MSFLVRIEDIEAIPDDAVRVILARAGIQGLIVEDREVTLTFDDILSRGLAQEGERSLWDVRNQVAHAGDPTPASPEDIRESADLHLRIYGSLIGKENPQTQHLTPPWDELDGALWWASDMNEAMQDLTRCLSRGPLASPYHWNVEPREDFAETAYRFLCRIHPPSESYSRKGAAPHVLPPGKRSIPAISRVPDGRVQLILFVVLLEYLVPLWKPEWMPTTGSSRDIGPVMHANQESLDWLRKPGYLLASLGLRNDIIYGADPIPDDNFTESRVDTVRFSCEEIAYRIGQPILDAVVFDTQASLWPQVDEGPWGGGCAQRPGRGPFGDAGVAAATRTPAQSPSRCAIGPRVQSVHCGSGRVHSPGAAASGSGHRDTTGKRAGDGSALVSGAVAGVAVPRDLQAWRGSFAAAWWGHSRNRCHPCVPGCGAGG